MRVAASEALTLNVIAGNISASGTAAVGAAVAVPVVTKQTHASIGNFATVSAAGNDTLSVVNGPFGLTTVDMRFDPLAAGVVTGGDTINLTYKHGMKTGDQAIYDDGGGTAITGLVDGGVYWVLRVDDDSLRLASTYCNLYGIALGANATCDNGGHDSTAWSAAPPS